MIWKSGIGGINSGLLLALIILFSSVFLTSRVLIYSGEVVFLCGLFSGASAVAFIYLFLRKKSILKWQKVRNSEDWCFNQTLSSLVDAVIRTDSKGFINFINEAACTVTGWSDQEALGRHIDIVLDFNTGSRLSVAKISPSTLPPDMMGGKYPGRFLKIKNGNEVCIELKSSPIKNTAGDTTGFVLVFSDITEKKSSEEERMRNEDLLEAILENIPSTIFIKDPHTLKYLRVNKGGEQLMGVSRHELLGKNDFELFTKEQSEFINKKDREVLNKGSIVDVPAQRINTKGGERWIHTRKIPIINAAGETMFLLGISEDITERKELERQIELVHEGLEQKILERTEELVQQKKFTENIINNVPTDIAVFDPEHNYLYVNPQALSSTEMRQWIIGKNDFDYCELKGLDATSARNRRKFFEKAVQTKRSVEWIDEHLSKQGEKKYVLRKFHPNFENDLLVNVIGYGLDITDLKRAEEVKKEYIQALEEMMFITSHKVRQPVSQIMEISVLLESEIDSQEELNNIIDFMKESVSNLDSFTRELTTFIRDLREKNNPEYTSETAQRS
jgi:PAS domain S-box-containing protein